MWWLCSCAYACEPCSGILQVPSFEERAQLDLNGDVGQHTREQKMESGTEVLLRRQIPMNDSSTVTGLFGPSPTLHLGGQRAAARMKISRYWCKGKVERSVGNVRGICAQGQKSGYGAGLYTMLWCCKLKGFQGQALRGVKGDLSWRVL